MRPASAARLALGSACLVAPTRVLGLVGGADRSDRCTVVVTRVLGARLVGQAGLDLALGRRSRALDVAVDLTHAASMLPVAARWPTHRRTALASACLATAIALLDVSDTPTGG